MYGTVRYCICPFPLRPSLHFYFFLFSISPSPRAIKNRKEEGKREHLTDGEKKKRKPVFPGSFFFFVLRVFRGYENPKGVGVCEGLLGLFRVNRGVSLKEKSFKSARRLKIGGESLCAEGDDAKEGYSEKRGEGKTIY